MCPKCLARGRECCCDPLSGRHSEQSRRGPSVQSPRSSPPASPVLQARADISLDGFARSLVPSTRTCACRACAEPVLGVRAHLLQPGRGGERMGRGAREKREGVSEGWKREMEGRQESILIYFLLCNNFLCSEELQS